ncbi:MAG: sulfatase-like hydrolase/transferase, partial [Rhodospirillales bacterium]|nr:sulfatase-like hydrolase/transferase [Rhodospirillales bacterium]
LNEIGPGESHYNRYDRLIADTGKQWLKDRASSPDDKPWVLYLSFVAPHFPLVVPQPYYDLYPLKGLPGRKLDPEAGYQRHPWLQRQDDFSQIDRNLSLQQRRMAVAAYFGLCTYVDALIGEVVDTLNDLGLADTTRIAYTSDHGDNVGARGMWGKSNLYQESAGIPLILSGPDVQAGDVCETPVSLLDTYQTVLQAAGLEPRDEEEALNGCSWFETAGAGYDPDRIVFSEYHAASSPTGAFMIRRGDFKLNYYVDYPPEFFDLKKDPEETQNVADDPAYGARVQEYTASLRDICDPEETDRRAKDDQNDLIERFGGREAALNTGTPGATPVPGQGHE